MWSEMFCNYCHPRYNESSDCGTCNPGYVNYSTCDFAVYVSGNWSFGLNLSNMLAPLVRSTFFSALAADLTRFVIVTLNCTESRNTTAYVTKYFDDTSTVAFTVAVLDPEPLNAYATAHCVDAGLGSAALLMELTNVSALVSRLFSNDPTAAVFAGNITASATVNASVPQVQLPCGGVWCFNALPITDAPEAQSYIWIVALAASLAALAAAAGSYFLWFRPRSAFRAKYAVNDPDFRRTRDLSDMEMEWCSAQLEDISSDKVMMLQQPRGLPDKSPLGRKI
jgi:hypothetical protein